MLSRLKRIAAVVCFSAAMGALAGCDSDVRRADRQIQEDLAKGIELASDGSENSVKQAQQLLESAASNAAASAATRANAKALLAQTELVNARTAQRKIDRMQIDLARLIWEADQLGLQIGTTNALVAGYRKYDPQDARANIEKAIADATGGPDKPAWFTHDRTTLPTLTAVREQISRLESEVATRQDKIKSLTVERDIAQSDAEQQSQFARSGRRGENMDAFNRASDLRKKASDLAASIDNEQSALIPYQRDLATAQAQQAVLEEVIAQLQSQGASLEAGWKTVQQQIDAQSNLARGILESSSADAGATSPSSGAIGGSIAQKAAEIERLVSELSTMRQQAMDDARNAASHYEEAAGAANDLARQVQTQTNEIGSDRAEAKAWTEMKNAISPSTFQLQESAAQRTLASLYASQAAEYGMRIMLRNSLSPSVEAAGLPLPASLEATNLEVDREKAVKDAGEAYSEANKLLDNVAEGQRDEGLANAAQVARILTLFGWSMLERQSNETASADEHLQLAIQYRNTAVEQNMPLPGLPAGLGTAPKPAATPTTEPSGDDASAAPVDGAAAPSDDAATAPAEPDATPATEPAADGTPATQPG